MHTNLAGWVLCPVDGEVVRVPPGLTAEHPELGRREECACGTGGAGGGGWMTLRVREI